MKKVMFLVGLIVLAAMVATVEAADLTLKWAFNTSAQFPGKTFGAGHQGPFTVWDLDGDGVNEIVWGTRRGDSRREWCIKADGKTIKWVYPPIASDPLPGDPIGQPSLVDVNNDGKYEVCFAGRGGRLHVVKADGTALWTFDNPVANQNMLGAPQAYDVNGDGFVEFMMADGGGFVQAVDHLGKLMWTSFQCGKANEGHSTIADVDRDGEVEVLWASQDFNLYCINAKTGAEKWRFNSGYNMQTNANIVVDVNKDGEYEVLIWNDNGQVFAVSFFGTEVWRLDLPRPAFIRLRQPIGDVNGDGSLDMPIIAEDALYLYDIGGAAPVKKWEINLTKWSAEGKFGGAKAVASGWSAYHTIADINGDDKFEILWLVPFPVVTDVSGNLLAYYYNANVQDGARQENGAWFGDVDKDGKSEWIAELNGKSHPQTQVYCLTMNGKFPAKTLWPEYEFSAYPASYQKAQSWLLQKSAYSCGLWFPMPEVLVPAIAAMLGVALLSRRK